MSQQPDGLSATLRTRVMVEKYDGPAPQPDETRIPQEVVVSEREDGRETHYERWVDGVLVEVREPGCKRMEGGAVMRRDHPGDEGL